MKTEAINHLLDTWLERRTHYENSKKDVIARINTLLYSRYSATDLNCVRDSVLQCTASNTDMYMNICSANDHIIGIKLGNHCYTIFIPKRWQSLTDEYALTCIWNATDSLFVDCITRFFMRVYVSDSPVRVGKRIYFGWSIPTLQSAILYWNKFEYPVIDTAYCTFLSCAERIYEPVATYCITDHLGIAFEDAKVDVEPIMAFCALNKILHTIKYYEDTGYAVAVVKPLA